MNVKIHYRITQDRAGLPSEYVGARHVVLHEGHSAEDVAKTQLAADYQVPQSAVEIIRIEQ